MPEMLSRPSQSGILIPLIGAPRLSLPMDEVKVSAGFPSPAADYEEKRLDINGQLTYLSDRIFQEK
jgi:hypothetical protein